MELAKRLNIKDYPIVSKQEYLSNIIQPLKVFDKDISLDKIKNTYFTIHEPVPWEDKKFNTTTGKFELYSSFAKKDGLSPIPIYIESKKENKFRLLTNHDKESLSSQKFIDKKGISKAYINEKMAININIENNEVVSLCSKDIKVNVEINIDNSISDNIIMMYVGWWKEHGNPNYLTVSDISDMGGQITYNETFIDIMKQN